MVSVGDWLYGLGMAVFAAASVGWYPAWRWLARRRQRDDLMAVADATREPVRPALHVVREGAS